MTDANIPAASGSMPSAEEARRLLTDLDRLAEHRETPCGDGTIKWRVWGSGPAVLLLHGGAGSWRHWVRNLTAIYRDHQVIAPDLPGLGDSAPAPDAVGAQPIASLISQGLETIIGPTAPLHIAGFSFGGVIAGLVAADSGARTRSLTLIGTGGLGPPSRAVELLRVRGKTGEERLAAHRENLLRMMLSQPDSVDALALEIQEQNSQRARLNSGFMWMSTVLNDALPRVQSPVHAFWGDHEMPDRALLDARIALLRQARPDVEVEVIPNTGHWVFYEAAEHFNATFRRVLTVG